MMPGLHLILAAIVSIIAFAAAQAGVPTMRPGDARSGTLLFKAVEEGRYVAAPLVGTDIDIAVSGPTARARVTQHFYNPTENWVEGVYVYPLPENSAVDSLKMVIGDRIIIGDIKERQEAKRIYEEAKREGKKAALMEQERPNMFTNSVANIGPGETIVVQIEYQQSVPQSANRFSLRVPLVVAPRYNPKPLVQTVDFGGKGWGQISDPVPDRDRIEPPVLDPRDNAPVNPVTLTVRLQAGFPLGEVKSAYHTVKTESPSEDSRIVKIEGAVPADKDFELTWEPKAGQAPAAGLFHERLGGTDYLLAFVTPPVLSQAQAPRPREIIFVIDNSGSMGGSSIVQAKSSLLYGLRQLKPGDRFNVVRFDDTMEVLFPGAVPADMEHVGQAQTFVSALQANGGTEMVPAMKAALTDDGGAGAEMLRQVVFLTDGAIGNEQQLFETIASGLGRSRVFMVGIGSAPNSYLMRHAAELGRGSFTRIGSGTQVEERMRALFNKLEKPAVTDLSVKFSLSGADVTPRVLPDLYAGETLQIAAKLSSMGGKAEISGMIGDRPWTATLPLSGSAEGKGLSKLWAREKIADAEVEVTMGHISQASADQRILTLALEHSLISRLTSLVAVDKTPSRPAGATLVRADLPLNLPAGWDFDKVFGKRGGERGNGPVQDGGVVPAPDQGDALKLDAAYVQTIAAGQSPAQAQQAAKQQFTNVALPQTASDAPLYLWLGLLILIANVPLFVIARRQSRREAEWE
ncbi:MULTISPECIES: marine proteobacterial sortase target protein [Rhodomicrobium]|uniref:marine proteobacterial sortase target protein n=1 Tax=Rhodomicrobium TaxID=1068 RepID=UPI001FD932E6|nr:MULTISPECIES: marine proteobacterial sortase target protein [Rhodomicrobium]